MFIKKEDWDKLISSFKELYCSYDLMGDNSRDRLDDIDIAIENIKENSSDKMYVITNNAVVDDEIDYSIYGVATDKEKAKEVFRQAVEDGLLAELGAAGYSKSEIVDIISQAFPSIGIKNTEDGKYQCPNGTDKEAKELYNKFIEELTKATSVNSQELIEAQNKLFKISAEITENNRQLKSLEYSITMLQDSIEQKIEDAIDESEDIAENQQDDAKSVVSKRLSEYTNSNGDM